MSSSITLTSNTVSRSFCWPASRPGCGTCRRKKRAPVACELSPRRVDIGKLRHASLCDFSEYGGAHLVLEGRKGPVVVLLLPEKHIAGPNVMSGDRSEGILVSTNNGSMAIVGDKDEALHGVERQVRAALVWRL